MARIYPLIPKPHFLILRSVCNHTHPKSIWKTKTKLNTSDKKQALLIVVLRIPGIRFAHRAIVCLVVFVVFSHSWSLILVYFWSVSFLGWTADGQYSDVNFLIQLCGSQQSLAFQGMLWDNKLFLWYFNIMILLSKSTNSMEKYLLKTSRIFYLYGKQSGFLIPCEWV